MLIGSFQSKITDGNRVAVPKKLRTELGDRFIVAKWYEQCVVMISLTDWEALLQRLTGKQELLTRAVRDTDRFILGSAFEVEVDRQGRINLPANLSTFANLSSDVIFLGLGSRVEIWDATIWAKKEGEIASEAANLLENMSHD
ncbi:cell division/cell wall cluster transcriptional repressor MraZ [Candidatus Woesebacteria bacterium]|jgi:MraZ protein|nr:cell division/cell wall cluster transcriptional repressor MraZ [Candidatus Woesebacteria bacterium]